MGEEAGARMIVVYGWVCAMRERVAGQRRVARETVDGRLGRQRRTAVHRERTVQQGTSQMVHRDQQQHRHFLQFYEKERKKKHQFSITLTDVAFVRICYTVFVVDAASLGAIDIIDRVEDEVAQFQNSGHHSENVNYLLRRETHRL